MRVRLTVEYDGASFAGWQVQPGQRTVQGELESALYSLYGRRSCVVGSGRTDAGVHALAQVAHYDCDKEYAPAAIVSALNHYLPPAVRVKAARQVSDDFHARFSAKEKTYVYVMYRGDTDSALLFGRALRVGDVDLAAMSLAANRLIGTHDFRSFMAAGSEVKTTVRTVTAAAVTEANGLIRFEVTANGFLYNMVRIMTACLLRVGEGKMPPEEITRILEARDRETAKWLAPACGLYLKSVAYNDDGTDAN